MRALNPGNRSPLTRGRVILPKPFWYLDFCPTVFNKVTYLVILPLHIILTKSHILSVYLCGNQNPFDTLSFAQLILTIGTYLINLPLLYDKDLELGRDPIFFFEKATLRAAISKN